MTEIQRETPTQSGSEPSLSPSERDDADRQDSRARHGDGTEGPEAPDEPGPRPPGFPDPAGSDEASD